MKQNYAGLNKYLFFPALTVLLFSLSFTLWGCGSADTPLTRTGFYFDTVIGISLYDTHDEELLEECFAIAGKYENMFSRTKKNSDIWKINHASGNPVTVNEDTIHILKAALYYSELSEGRADLTIGAVNNLWDFTGDDANSAGTPTLPTHSELTEALSHVNYKLVSLSGNTVTLKDPKAELDLGFIAKGYIADRMKEYLLSEGINSALINLGGNVLTVGNKPDGTAFRIGVQKPFSPSGTTAFTLSADDMSVVSSGIYERYIKIGETVYHHILDTKTGYPVQNNLFQVTILSSSSADGDALSTICFVLGEEKGMELIEALDNTEAVFNTADGRLISSSGITFSE